MYKEEEMPAPTRIEGELEHSRFRETAERSSFKSHTDRTAYMRAQHYGEMTFIDDMVGKIIGELDELGIRENTLVVFVSDHGDMLGDHWLWWKGSWHWPECTAVPLFFNWPGRLMEGKSVEGMVQQTDILPTLVELAGLDMPPGIQGLSQLPVLTTETDQTGYEYAYTEAISSGEYHPAYLDQGGQRNIRKVQDPVNTYTIRSLKWRLTYFSGERSGELYDLVKDPDEFQNLWEDPGYREKKIELMEILMNRIAGTRDPLPSRIRPY
jgi:arylsulfatase A-like enzyme